MPTAKKAITSSSYALPIPWVLILTTIVVISLIYAFYPFIQQSTKSQTEEITDQSLPFINSTPTNIPIILPFRTIDPLIQPTSPVDDRLDPKYQTIDQQHLFLVQFKSSLSTPQNLSIITTFPTNTYLVRSDINQISQLKNSEQVNYITPYAPEFKIHPVLLKSLPPTKTDLTLNVIINPDPAITPDEFTQLLLNINPQITARLEGANLFP